jgi:phage host-nuclease inhibitor protein Gam
LNFFLFHLTDLLAKRPSIGDISTKLKVLETEHESLQASLKEYYENETKMKKELEDKHAKEMSEMTEKLKDSTKRFKTLASKLTAAEAEATDIDQMIFRKDF